MENSRLPLVCRETLRSLEESLDDQTDLSRNFVRRYVEMWPRRLARIQHAITTDNRKEAMDASLSLRSASFMVGATRLGDLVTKIIELIEAGPTTLLTKLITALHACGEQTMHHLKSS